MSEQATRAVTYQALWDRDLPAAACSAYVVPGQGATTESYLDVSSRLCSLELAPLLAFHLDICVDGPVLISCAPSEMLDTMHLFQDESRMAFSIDPPLHLLTCHNFTCLVHEDEPSISSDGDSDEDL